MGSITCPKCHEENFGNIRYCGKCGASLSGVSEHKEAFVKKLNINYIKRNWVFPIIGLTFKSGVLVLTADRIIVNIRNTWLFYLAGVFAYKSDGKFAFDIPLGQLKELYRKKAGLLGKAICIVTRDGKAYRFVIKSGEFLKALEDTLAEHHKSRLSQDADSHWVVEAAG